jgi:hypothetical protein
MALALLERFAPDNTPLAGDLVEEFMRRQSPLWFWWQALAAIATAPFHLPDEIRPIRLVEHQPFDAVERTRSLSCRFPPINLTASPVYGVSGFTFAMLCVHMTVVLPGAWLFVLVAVLNGILLGWMMIARHGKPHRSITTIQT